jgi:hypothetical protein
VVCPVADRRPCGLATPGDAAGGGGGRRPPPPPHCRPRDRRCSKAARTAPHRTAPHRISSQQRPLSLSCARALSLAAKMQEKAAHSRFFSSSCVRASCCICAAVSALTGLSCFPLPMRTNGRPRRDRKERERGLRAGTRAGAPRSRVSSPLPRKTAATDCALDDDGHGSGMRVRACVALRRIRAQARVRAARLDGRTQSSCGWMDGWWAWARAAMSSPGTELVHVHVASRGGLPATELAGSRPSIAAVWW